MNKLLIVEHSPKEYPKLEGNTLLSRLGSKLIRAQNYKRNPRSSEYMRTLAMETLGIDGGAFRSAKGLTAETISACDRIILLWPDGNGYGWHRIEESIFRHKKAGATVSVLNGRKRFFPLSLENRRGYLLRRVLERFWIGEALFVLLFAVFTPPFLLIDTIRGKR